MAGRHMRRKPKESGRTCAADALPNICARLVEWSEIMGYSFGNRTFPVDDCNEFTSSKREKDRFVDKKNAFLSSECKFSQASVNVCVKCNKGGNLLVCGTNSCSFAIHEHCLGSLLSFGRMGVFYCPFCSYFQAISKHVDIERKAYLMRKDLANFLCSMRERNLDGLPSKSSRTRQNQTKSGDGLLQSRRAGYSSLSPGDNPTHITKGTTHPLHTDEKRTEMSHGLRVHGQDELAGMSILKSRCENASCQKDSAHAQKRSEEDSGML